MHPPLRIALLTNNYTPYSGGVVSSINVLATSLQQKGHDISVVTLDFLGRPKDDRDYVYRVPCPVRFKYKKNHMALPWRTTYHVTRHLDQIKADVVHVHHPFLLGVAGLKAARKLNVPIIFTYHTLYEAYHHYVPFFPDLTKVAINKLVTSFCKEVDHIIAPSTFIKKSIQSAHVPTPVTVVPSAIQDCFVSQCFTKKQRGDKFTLLSVGRFAKEKNLAVLLDAVAQLDKRFNLIFAGYGYEQAYLHWYAYTKLQLTQEQVQFVTRPAQYTLVQLYRQADLFLFSSTTDTQGLVLAEAMAAATPVVALDGPGQQDIVESGYNGYLVVSLQEMISSISKIAEDQRLHEQLQQGAWETSKRYEPEVYRDVVESIYLNQVHT